MLANCDGTRLAPRMRSAIRGPVCSAQRLVWSLAWVSNSGLEERSEVRRGHGIDSSARRACSGGGFLLRQAYLQRGQTPLGVAQAVSLVFAALSEPTLGNPSKAEAKD